jgi:hypothetical protein
MPNFPFRNVGAQGIITDKSPYDLGPEAWSDGRNVRFSGGTVSRYSTFKNAYPALTLVSTGDNTVVGGGVRRTPSGDSYFHVSRDFIVTSPVGDGTATTVLRSTAETVSDLRCTTAFVGGVTYLNRPDQPLQYITPAMAEFADVPNWVTTDRAKAIREFGDFAIGLGITQDGVEFPSMYKWSDTVQYGAVADFDLELEGTNAGANVLNDAQSGLVDGLSLRDVFIMYTETDAHELQFIGGPFVFRSRRLFADDGAMSVNCVVEVNNKHYVFGAQDIYVHDGITKQSITEERIKEQLYSIINFEARDRCYVYHDAEHSEIGFAFNTLIDESIPSETGDCNMAYVYNYATGTWAPVDLPSTVVSMRMKLNTAQTWATLDLTWAEMGSQWTSFAGSQARTLGMVSTRDGEPRFLMLDDAIRGRSAMPPVTTYLYDAYVERVGMDMDNIGAEITGRKLLKRLLPQVFMDDPARSILIQLGRSRFSGSTVVWEDPRSFNPSTQYKVDSRNTGRYLAIRVQAPGGVPFELSGYDMQLEQISRR